MGPIGCETDNRAAFDPASQQFLRCLGRPTLGLGSFLYSRSTLQGHLQIGLTSA